MRNYRHYHGSNMSFIDMLFNIVLVFVLLFLIAILLVNPPAKKADIEAKADIIVTMSWPDLSPHDIDLLVKPPDGHPIFYGNRENTYIFLDRDDLGISNNYVIKDGEKIALAPRREVVSFRGKVNGRYVVNSLFYASKSSNPDGGLTPYTYDGKPIPVIVELIQINPEYKILARKELTLSAVREEKTAFSFIINNDVILDIDTETEEPFIRSGVNPEGR